MLKTENGEVITRSYQGKLPSDKYTDEPSERYDRAHEKRRLKAYLKGKEYFIHGFEHNNFIKWPARFPVVPVTPKVEG